MNRRDFGLWGIELSSGEFAQALATLGVLVGIYSSWPIPGDPDFIDRALERAFKKAEGRPVRWSLLFEPYFTSEGPSCRALAEAWQRSLEHFGQPRLEIGPYRRLDTVWIMEELSRTEVGAASVYVPIEDDPEAAVGWQWPLRVGLLPGPATAGLRGELEAVQERNWAGRVAQLIELSEAEESCDLLLLPLDLPAALAAVLTFPGSIRADCVLVLGRASAPSERLISLLGALRAPVRTSGAGLATVPSGSRGEWFKSLLRELSHNLHLDVALTTACRKAKVRGPFMLLSRRLVEFHLAERVRKMAESFESVGEAAVEIPRGSAFEKNLTMAGNYRLRDIGERLRSVPDDVFFYTHESDMASVAAEASELARGAREVMAPEPPQERFLQAQVFDASLEQKGQRLVRAWRAGAPHAVAVRIGAPDEEWLAPAPLSPFPDQELPQDHDEHRLTVVFSEPYLLSEPQTAEIVLPRRGNSSPCMFYLHVKEGTERVEARVIVLYANRVLQTALLCGEVAPNPEEAEGPGIELTVEAVVRPGLANLDIRRRFDASLVLNHDSRSLPRVTVIVDKVAKIATHSGMQRVVDWFESELTKIAFNRAEFADGLTGKATVDLLRSFAQNGRELYEYVVELRGYDPIYGKERIQIISTQPDDYFPAEFLYERQAPLPEAPLCPNAAESLRAGQCDESCPRGADEDKVICPLAFWGMSKVLERHAHDPDFPKTLEGVDFAFQAETSDGRQELKLLGETLLAASHRVDASCKGGMKSIRKTVKTALKRSPRAVKKWEDWSTEVVSKSPTLLVLLVHTDRVSPGNVQKKMEIGKGSWLGESNLTTAYVRPSLEKPPPLVLLLGCETADSELPFYSFVAKFRRRGAAIVLSTGSAVHSVHAVPVARRYIEILARLIGSGGGTFGEVMRTARRELLAEGFPMVLCLAAYGDADWRLV